MGFEKLSSLFLTMCDGALVTLSLFAITLVLSVPLGFLFALIRVSKNKVAAKIMSWYVWFFRGTPLLLQLLFVYFGLGGLGIPLESYPSAIIAFTLNYAAYFAEIFRGGIQSIERGQYEAADVLGLSKTQMMTRIVLPQTFKRVMPALGNEVINLVKDTSLVYTLAMQEIVKVAKNAAVRDLSLTPYVMAFLFYLVFTYIITKILERVERAFNYYE
jgi:polar amino acid transport system permease protein